MRTLLLFGASLSAASAHAAPTEWLDGTVLEECEPCRTDAFSAERKRIANQAGATHDPASGMGYIVTREPDGFFVWGRAALVGTGNLIRTDAHVLVTDTGEFKTADGKIYFEPMQHRGASNLIELDLSSVQRGGPLGPLETDVKNDWAIARLKEDAIEKFAGDRVFAFLWNVRLTHDELVKQSYRQASALVLSQEHQYRIDQSCGAMTENPSGYVFGVEEVFFTRCPSAHMQVGSSGSTLAVSAPDGTWHLGGQLIAGTTSQGVQLLLGNVPTLRETLTIAYLQELLRRGIDPRAR